MSEQVGYLGLGRMGGAMVRRLLDAGHDVAFHARNPDTVATFTQLGARSVESAGDLACQVDILLTCLFDDAQIAAVIDGPAGVAARLRPGAILVIHSTTSPDRVRGLQERAAARGASVIDAPVSGSVEDILAGRLSVMVGGDTSSLDRLGPIIADYAQSVIFTGDVGSASTVKLVNNLLFAANSQLVGSAVALGERLGVEPSILLNSIAQCSGSSQALERIVGMGSVLAYERRVREFLSKDATLALELAGVDGAELFRTVVQTGPMDLSMAASGPQLP